MKFTLSWLKEHLDTEASLDEIVDALNMIGLEVEDVDDKSALAPFVIARVISAEQHPDADRLRVLSVDTGSGRVEASRISADEATIDTGNGSVVLELDRMGTGDFEIDTGSGSINLVVPAGTSADVSASTGSGGIKIDLDSDYRMTHMEEDEAEFEIGGGGGADVTLDTGSGSIRVSDR